MPLIPLEVDHQTVHAVPKYEIQIRCKIGENCSSLEVKTFLLFFGVTFHHKSGKNCGFFLKLIGRFIKFKRMPIPNHFQCLKSIGKQSPIIIA